MSSSVEYYRQRLNEQKFRLDQIEDSIKHPTITGKKRKYEDAMGYPNDYEVVQAPESVPRIQVKGNNWVDAYLEHLPK